MNEILRRYMLENNPTGPGGEPLMEAAAEAVFNSEPEVTPTPEREADMVSRLQQNFPESPIPGPAAGTSALKMGLIGTGALILVTTVILLVFNPFGSDTPTNTNVYIENITSAQPHANPSHLETPATNAEDKDLPSLQLYGDGTPKPTSDDQVGKGTSGSEDRGSKVFRKPSFLPNPGDNLAGSRSPDLPTVSPNLEPSRLADATSDHNSAPAVAKEVMDPFPLRSLYAQTSTQSKYYHLEPGKDHMVKGNKGTLLHIPRNAFVDATSGEAVHDIVQVEVKEVYRRSDLVKTNLPTVSNGRQIVSGGVLYIDAKAGNRRLRLAKGKDIFVEFTAPKGVDTRDMDLAHGAFNERGEMNWVPMAGEFTKMIPLPPKGIYLEEFMCQCDDEALWNFKVNELSDEFYDGTWVMTREFRQRMGTLRDIGYYVEGLLIYEANINKPLWKVDQMVADKLLEDVGKGKMDDADVEKFQHFAQQMLTEIEPFDDRGIDLGGTHARQQLLYHGVSREEGGRLLRLHKIREQLVAQLESSLIFEKSGKEMYAIGRKRGKRIGAIVRSFLVRELGWISMYRIADKKFVEGKTRDLKVRLSGDVPYNSTKVFLVYSGMNSVMPARKNTGQQFKIKDVPKNQQGWIVAVGYQNMMPHLGMKRLPADGKQAYVRMERMQIDNFIVALKSLD
ncbi:MAG: hypothetical protein AAF570_03175 [Bacteroidota bacterium]